MQNKYSLLLAAMPNNDYAAGWLAGSIIAHKIYSDQCDKVFWVCPVRGIGLSSEEKELLSTGSGINQMLDKTGFFYDGKEGAVSWLFELEGIYSSDEIRDSHESFEKYIGFRKIYLDSKKGKKYYWILIKNLRRLCKPYKKISIGRSVYEIPSFHRNGRTGNIITHDFMHGGAVFAIQYPQAKELAVTNYNAETITDLYLKELLLGKHANARLKENAVQLAFALKLMQQKRNWSLVMEKQLPDKKRIDLMFKEGNDLVVVEIKRSDNDDPVGQLKNYICELQGDKTIINKYKKIRGAVVCGTLSDAVKAAAKRENFQTIQYSLSMDFSTVA